MNIGAVHGPGSVDAARGPRGVGTHHLSHETVNELLPKCRVLARANTS
jgi:hypothetical protein